jgi:hypothetical protein
MGNSCSCTIAVDHEDGRPAVAAIPPPRRLRPGVDDAALDEAENRLFDIVDSVRQQLTHGTSAAAVAGGANAASPSRQRRQSTSHSFSERHTAGVVNVSGPSPRHGGSSSAAEEDFTDEQFYRTPSVVGNARDVNAPSSSSSWPNRALSAQERIEIEMRRSPLSHSDRSGRSQPGLLGNHVHGALATLERSNEDLRTTPSRSAALAARRGSILIAGNAPAGGASITNTIGVLSACGATVTGAGGQQPWTPSPPAAGSAPPAAVATIVRRDSRMCTSNEAFSVSLLKRTTSSHPAGQTATPHKSNSGMFVPIATGRDGASVTNSASATPQGFSLDGASRFGSLRPVAGPPLDSIACSPYGLCAVPSALIPEQSQCHAAHPNPCGDFAEDADPLPASQGLNPLASPGWRRNVQSATSSEGGDSDRGPDDEIAGRKPATRSGTRDYPEGDFSQVRADFRVPEAASTDEPLVNVFLGLRSPRDTLGAVAMLPHPIHPPRNHLPSFGRTSDSHYSQYSQDCGFAATHTDLLEDTAAPALVELHPADLTPVREHCRLRTG